MLAYTEKSYQHVCSSPEQCRERMEAVQRRMQQNHFRILAEYEALLGDHCFHVTEHADQRMRERGISFRAVCEVLECFQPVEWWTDAQCNQSNIGYLARQKLHIQPYRILVAGEPELYDHRPLGIFCSYGERPRQEGKWHLRIRTVCELDVRKWSTDLSKRICFCSEKEEEQLMSVERSIRRYYEELPASQNSVVYSTF